MIPKIDHPAAALLVLKLNEAAAIVASHASQLDGLARALIAERDSNTNVDGFRTAFPTTTNEALEAVVSFREFYRLLAGHDVPPLDGQPRLALPDLPSAPSDDAVPPLPAADVSDAAAPAAVEEAGPPADHTTPEPPPEQKTPASKTRGK